MLGSRRRAKPEASYAVVWANLRRRYPGLRTVLITGASTRDDPSVAAVGLAEAAATLDGSTVLVMVLDSAMQDQRVAASPGPSVRTIAGLSPGQVRTVLSDQSEDFAFVLVVAPAPQQGPDCIAMARLAQAAIMVAGSGRTRIGEARLAAELLRDAGLPIAVALLLTSQALGSRKSLGGRSFKAAGQIAELRPRAELNERREATAGIDLLS